jgi:hypothetical protein
MPASGGPRRVTRIGDVTGRLKPGVTLAAAESELKAIEADLKAGKAILANGTNDWALYERLLRAYHGGGESWDVMAQFGLVVPRHRVLA